MEIVPRFFGEVTRHPKLCDFFQVILTNSRTPPVLQILIHRPLFFLVQRP
jgi:hypothetical protein